MNNTIQWHRRSYTQEQFIKAWEESKSVTECARKLNLNIYGSTHTTIKETALSLGLTKDHFTGSGWRKGSTVPMIQKRPIEVYLVENRKVSISSLKKRLIKEKILVNKCAAPFCPVPNPSVNPFTGESTPLKLALDHVNGINTDNRLENLRLLCYHCHGETDTWCGSDRKKKRPKVNPSGISVTKIWYCECGKEKTYRAKKCMDCYKAQKPLTKITLTPDEIVVLIESGNETYESLGRAQEVSGNAIRKFLKRNDIIPPKSSNKKQSA